jgi:hypothetical protein
MEWHAHVTIGPTTPTYLLYTSSSRGMPILHKGCWPCSGNTFQVQHHGVSAWESESDHGVQGEWDAGRSACTQGGGSRVDGEGDRTCNLHPSSLSVCISCLPAALNCWYVFILFTFSFGMKLVSPLSPLSLDLLLIPLSSDSSLESLVSSSCCCANHSVSWIMSTSLLVSPSSSSSTS